MMELDICRRSGSDRGGEALCIPSGSVGHIVLRRSLDFFHHALEELSAQRGPKSTEELAHRHEEPTPAGLRAPRMCPKSHTMKTNSHLQNLRIVRKHPGEHTGTKRIQVGQEAGQHLPGPLEESVT